MHKCHSCEEIVPTGAKKCPACGVYVLPQDADTKKTCIACNQHLPENVTKCPKCGTENTVKKHPNEGVPFRQRKTTPAGWAFVAFAVGLSALFIYPNIGKHSDERTCGKASDAFIEARNFIQPYLKLARPYENAPLGEIAGYWSSTVRKVECGSYRVLSYIEQKNAFGSVIKTPFEVKLRYRGKSYDVWYADLNGITLKR